MCTHPSEAEAASLTASFGRGWLLALPLAAAVGLVATDGGATCRSLRTWAALVARSRESVPLGARAASVATLEALPALVLAAMPLLALRSLEAGRLGAGATAPELLELPINMGKSNSCACITKMNADHIVVNTQNRLQICIRHCKYSRVVHGARLQQLTYLRLLFLAVSPCSFSGLRFLLS